MANELIHVLTRNPHIDWAWGLLDFLNWVWG